MPANDASDKADGPDMPRRPRAEADLAPSLAEQLGRTRSSLGRLVSAHVRLLRAEIGAIVGQLKTMATLAGIALALLLTMANMLYIGGFLFVGEWLFGSMGWGLAHGTFFALGLAVVLLLLMVGAGIGSAVASAVIAGVVTVALAILLGSNVLHNSAAYVGQQLPAPLNSAPAVGLIGGALIVGLLFGLIFARVAGRGGALAGLVVGALMGLVLGYVVTSAAWTWPPAAGFATSIGLIAWPILHFALAWPGLDIGARFEQLQPRETIQTVRETREWLENQVHSRSPKLGRK